MDLPLFLSTVDAIASTMEKDRLLAFIHEGARVMPSSVRQAFLDKIQAYADGTMQDAPSVDMDALRAQCRSMQEELGEVGDGELLIQKDINEAYDDWYDPMEEEFLYADPDGIGDILGRACDLVHWCVDVRGYAMGYELAWALVTLTIDTTGSASASADTMDIFDLFELDLLDRPLQPFFLDALYAAYMAHALPERAAAMYPLFKAYGGQDLTMEMVMQRQQELPDVDEFLPLWIDYLDTRDTKLAFRLQKEAFCLLQVQGGPLEMARRVGGRHPSLYEEYLQTDPDHLELEELYAIGQEALERIDAQYLTRSRIALATAKMALTLGRKRDAEMCWLEAFRSDTSVENYLRLRIESDDFSPYEEEARRIYGSFLQCPEEPSRFQVFRPEDEQARNRPDVVDIYMCAFLDMQFYDIAHDAMKTDAALGWSYIFMKCGLAAFLLLLSEGDTLLPGGRAMCRKIVEETRFDARHYDAGLLEPTGEKDEILFWRCFCRWKQGIHLSDEEWTGYRDWAAALIERRTDGIMGTYRRKYYGECAAFIAALGEADESHGKQGAKQAIMEGYKQQWSRRIAFHEALRGYGMLDR